jgi:hypothetical protein
MIVTYAINPEGKARIYLGGKGSVEAYLEPAADGRTWSFHIMPAATGLELPPDTMRQWAVYTLSELATALDVDPRHLKDVPFDCIAALHAPDPFESRRIASPRRPAEHSYMAARPGTTRPATDFRSGDFARHSARRR